MQGLNQLDESLKAVTQRIDVLEQRTETPPAGDQGQQAANSAPQQTVGSMQPAQFAQLMAGSMATALQNHGAGASVFPLQAPAPADSQRSGGTPSGQQNASPSLAKPEEWKDREKFAQACADANPHDASAYIMAQNRWDAAHDARAAS